MTYQILVVNAVCFGGQRSDGETQEEATALVHVRDDGRGGWGKGQEEERLDL